MRFVMFYPEGGCIEDDGRDVEVTFRVPRAWLSAPRDGLQYVVKHRDDGKIQVLSSADYYGVMTNGEPMSTDDLSTMMRALGLVKSGLWLPDAEFEVVRDRVRDYRKAWEKACRDAG